MLDALRQHIPGAAGVTWTHPSGGLYVWVTLPTGMDASRTSSLFRMCVEKGVLYVPGDYCFQADENGVLPRNHLRLSFGQVAPDQIGPGIQRLAQAIAAVVGQPAPTPSTSTEFSRMSKTLFWYIFGNLLRVFLLTTAGLAGIMSFAVLLRPLTENGLDFGQVNRLLVFSLPAVCALSLPVSALFATTMVYGRFSADNELTAMRASGISYFSARRFSVALPALVLGLVVATISLLMLCFIVPVYSLKVEEVIYSNIARVIANRIERHSHPAIPKYRPEIVQRLCGRSSPGSIRPVQAVAAAGRAIGPGMDDL